MEEPRKTRKQLEGYIFLSFLLSAVYLTHASCGSSLFLSLADCGYVCEHFKDADRKVHLQWFHQHNMQAARVAACRIVDATLTRLGVVVRTISAEP